MNALEEEILRLRDQEKYLIQIADDWERCTSFLMKLEPAVSFRNGAPVTPVQFGPSLLISTVTTLSRSEAAGQVIVRPIHPPLRPHLHSLRSRLSEFGIDEILGLRLFQSCE